MPCWMPGRWSRRRALPGPPGVAVDRTGASSGLAADGSVGRLSNELGGEVRAVRGFPVGVWSPAVSMRRRHARRCPLIRSVTRMITLWMCDESRRPGQITWARESLHRRPVGTGAQYCSVGPTTTVAAPVSVMGFPENLLGARLARCCSPAEKSPSAATAWTSVGSSAGAEAVTGACRHSLSARPVRRLLRPPRGQGTSCCSDGLAFASSCGAWPRPVLGSESGLEAKRRRPQR